jgi:Cu/Ag efflux protein CusF
MSDTRSLSSQRLTSPRPWLIAIAILLLLGLGVWGLLNALKPEKGTWLVAGTVDEVGQDTIIINHETIPDLMKGHSMLFFVESKALLNGIKAGDRVRFVLKSTPGALLIVRLEKRR